jgi:uncharacterized protein (TIGR02217 family)
MAFHEVRFPTNISLGASGGPERKTDIVTLASGKEQRNAIWANSRRRYDAGFGIKGPNDLHAVIEFFEARTGRLHGFRWKDWADFKSVAPQTATSATDQTIGTGNGATAAFQLVKAYTSGGSTWTRTIDKPVSGTVLISVNGVTKTSGTHFNVDSTTGMVTFTGGNIPPNGHLVKAGFEFDVPVRFDADYLPVMLAHANAGDIPNIAIVELRL